MMDVAVDLAAFIARLPHLEDLHLGARGIDPSKVFRLKSLGQLRVLSVENAADYDLKEEDRKSITSLVTEY